MFKQARRRIVISILAILCAVLVGTLGLIYLSSYLSVSSRNYRVLEKHAEMLTNGPGPERDNGVLQDISPENGQPNEDMRGQGKFDRNLEIGTFYAVKLAADGTAAVIENDADGVYSGDDLIELAGSVQSGSKGKTGDLLYVVKQAGSDVIVCFMDNTVFSESFTRLFYFTLLFGVIALLAIALISLRIAESIVSPMEETYQKQKQFTADAGHELKTPIAAVAANIELLRRETGDNQWLENIAYENERMRDLVTDLLELAQNENKKPERKPTDLSRLVNGAILPLEAAAFEKNVLIEADIPEGVTANIDEKSVAQLVTILLDNAVSHTKCSDGEKGTVFIKLCEAKGAAVLSVSNPGEEIPAEEREKLFERFYRGDSSREFTGHYGLGLAIARAIADANAARISVDCADGLVTFTAAFPAK
ncbi:MAG: HAMP domain-containing histidine kinase [Firmicutes bacterium]|nr:HAMP domain-containing histidine kinase [Bacillota bacterium]